MVLAVPVPRHTKRYKHVINYTDLPRITLQRVQHLFEHYKDLAPRQMGEDEPVRWVPGASSATRAGAPRRRGQI
jgi:inorganic pyrophosphatase